ncbi:MAG TPA: TraB/GumN family protein [Candidatus Angelobacter sp.]|jgi:hypothetical protein|nr:TraB/GumN family protein [Candidatus Angelobacter sp.]
MKKRLRACVVYLLPLLAAFSLCQAQTAAPQQAKTTQRLFMWKATSPTNTVYLFGSIHVGDSSLYPLPRAVESAFAASKVLAVEFNIKSVDQMKMLKLIQENGMYSNDDSLSQHISKETSAALDEFCSKNGMPRMMLDRTKPWVAAITVIALAAKAAGEDPELGIDMHFLNEVKEPQRIDELESADFQVSILSSATEQEQQEFLAASLKQADKVKDMVHQMQQAYTSGDTESLEKLVREEEGGPKTLMKKLLDDRNVTMAQRVEQYLKGKEPSFVVVGAGHMIGEKGIVKLLQEKGYHVERANAGP